MTAKRIYLDVDGVLNAVRGGFPSENHSGWAANSWSREDINGFPIRWSSELVDALNELVADGVEIRWLTTWCELAQQMIAPALGLAGGGTWELAAGVTADEAHMYDLPRTWWKCPVFETDMKLDPADKVVWIDDDHGLWTEGAVIDNLKRENRLRVFAPEMTVGITRLDIERVREFLFEEDVQVAPE